VPVKDIKLCEPVLPSGGMMKPYESKKDFVEPSSLFKSRGKVLKSD